MKKKTCKVMKLAKWKMILLSSAIFFSVSLLSYAADNVYENYSYPSGFDLTGEHLIMATRQLSNGGTLVSAPSSHVTLRAPKIVLGNGFHAKRGSNVLIGPPVFYLNFVVVNAQADFPDHDGITSADDPTCTPKRDPSGFHCIVREDIDLLLDFFNNNFVSEDGVQIVNFKLGGFTSFNDLLPAQINSPLFNSINNIGYPTPQAPTGYTDVAANFLSCTDSNFCDHNAINVYIYDNNYPGEGNNGHGNNNNHEPIVLVDFERIKNIDITTGMPVGEARPFLHEFGHAFDLGHVCQTGVTLTGDRSNLMASGYFCADLDNIYCGDTTISCLDAHTMDYCRCLMDNSISNCNSIHSVNDIATSCTLGSKYCPELANYSYGDREAGVSYDSLLSCPDSSQNYWSDEYDPYLGCPTPYQDWCDNSLPDYNDGDSTNPLSQMEIIYWNSGIMQYTLTPTYPH